MENYSADLDGRNQHKMQQAFQKLLHHKDVLRWTWIFEHVCIDLTLKETFVTAMCKNAV